MSVADAPYGSTCKNVYFAVLTKRDAQFDERDDYEEDFYEPPRGGGSGGTFIPNEDRRGGNNGGSFYPQPNSGAGGSGGTFVPSGGEIGGNNGGSFYPESNSGGGGGSGGSFYPRQPTPGPYYPPQEPNDLEPFVVLYLCPCPQPMNPSEGNKPGFFFQHLPSI